MFSYLDYRWIALQGSGGQIKQEMEKTQAALSETVNNIKEVQAYALESHVSDGINRSIKETVTKASTKQAILKGLMMGMIQLVQFSVYAFAFWVGGQLIVNGDITFEDFNKSMWAMAFAASGLGQAAIFAGDTAKASSAVKAIFAILDRRPSIDSEPWERDGLAELASGEAAVRKHATTAPKAIEGDVFQGEFDLTKVNFAYPTRKAAKVFDDITLRIPAGKSSAIVGASGAGKSSVVQLLERFYDPVVYKKEGGGGGASGPTVEIVLSGGEEGEGGAGRIELDGSNTKVLDARWLRANMGLVGQEPVLFNDTIYNNIALGMAEKGSTMEMVQEAATLANAHSFIMELDDQYETNVGNAGGKVSGGQKQRIASK